MHGNNVLAGSELARRSEVSRVKHRIIRSCPGALARLLDLSCRVQAMQLHLSYCRPSPQQRGCSPHPDRLPVPYLPHRVRQGARRGSLSWQRQHRYQASHVLHRRPHLHAHHSASPRHLYSLSALRRAPRRLAAPALPDLAIPSDAGRVYLQLVIFSKTPRECDVEARTRRSTSSGSSSATASPTPSTWAWSFSPRSPSRWCCKHSSSEVMLSNGRPQSAAETRHEQHPQHTLPSLCAVCEENLQSRPRVSQAFRSAVVDNSTQGRCGSRSKVGDVPEHARVRDKQPCRDIKAVQSAISAPVDVPCTLRGRDCEHRG